MRLDIPHHLTRSSFRLTVRVAGGWSQQMELDDSFKFVDVDLPADVNADDVEAFIEPLTGSGHVDEHAIKPVLKTAKRPRRGKR